MSHSRMTVQEDVSQHASKQRSVKDAIANVRV